MKETTEKKSTESPIIEDEVQGDENESVTMDYRPRQKVNLSRRSSTDSSKGKRRARRRNSGKAKQLELYSTGYVIIYFVIHVERPFILTVPYGMKVKTPLFSIRDRISGF